MRQWWCRGGGGGAVIPLGPMMIGFTGQTLILIIDVDLLTFTTCYFLLSAASRKDENSNIGALMSKMDVNASTCQRMLWAIQLI